VRGWIPLSTSVIRSSNDHHSFSLVNPSLLKVLTVIFRFQKMSLTPELEPPPTYSLLATASSTNASDLPPDPQALTRELAIDFQSLVTSKTIVRLLLIRLYTHSDVVLNVLNQRC